MGSFWSKSANTGARLDGKTAVITGANSGIGKVTAQDFYQRGARVIMACRNEDNCKQAQEEIKQLCVNKEQLGELTVTKLDLSSLKSVRACAKELTEKEKQINLLINNAGVMALPELTRTVDGHEMQLGTNHLGHFLLTLLLMPKLIESAPSRIVNVSSVAHKFTRSLDVDDLNYENRKYGANNAYIQSKLCNVLFTNELARQLEENKIEGVHVYSLHPGLIKTNLGRHMETGIKKILGMVAKTPEQGAQTTIYCGVSEQCAKETGLYYAECKPSSPSKTSQDEILAKQLWNKSLKMVGLDEKINYFKSKGKHFFK